METRNENTKPQGRELTKEEFRQLMPERINKLGEWVLENRTAWQRSDGSIVLL